MHNLHYVNKISDRIFFINHVKMKNLLASSDSDLQDKKDFIKSFKIQHRQNDVFNAQEELMVKKLENMRKAGILSKDEFEDETDKIVVNKE